MILTIGVKALNEEPRVRQSLLDALAPADRPIGAKDLTRVEHVKT